MGVHTANLPIKLAKTIHKGLYLSKVTIENKDYKGLTYYGINSLTNKDCLEVHILGFDNDIYGKEITVETQK